MNMTRPMTLMELVQDTVLQHSEGVAGIAEELGKSPSTVYSEINPNDPEPDRRTHKLGLMDWTKVLRKTGDLRSLHKVNEIFDLVAVSMDPIAKKQDALSRGWLKYIAAISKETGETVAALAEAIADGKITPEENRKCRKETYEALQALAGLWVTLGRLNK